MESCQTLHKDPSAGSTNYHLLRSTTRIRHRKWWLLQVIASCRFLITYKSTGTQIKFVFVFLFVLSIPYSFSKATADLQDAPELLEMMKWLRNFGSSAARCWELSGMESNERIFFLFPMNNLVYPSRFIIYIIINYK